MRTKSFEEIVAEAGGEFRGIQKAIGNIPDHVLFNDPQTHSTLAVPVKGLTVEAVRKKLAASRRRFEEAKTWLLGQLDIPGENQKG